MVLYKCSHFKVKLCKDYEGCHCKYTFDPMHIWSGDEVLDLINSKKSIQCDASDCPADVDTVTMQPYKEGKEK